MMKEEVVSSYPAASLHEPKALQKVPIYILAAAGGITTVLLLSYLCVFGQQVGSNWTIGRQLAAYALGIMGLVALNGVIAVLWMAAGCFGTSRDSSTADDDVEIAAVAPDGYQPIAATEKYKAGGNGKDSQRVCVMVTAA